MILHDRAVRHKIDMAARSALVYQPDRLHKNRVIPFSTEALDVYVHYNALGKRGKYVRKLDNTRSREMLPLLYAEIQRSKFGIRMFIDIARAVGNSLKRRVVNGDDFSVLSPPDVKLDFRCTKRNRRTESSHAVFRGDSGKTAMCTEAFCVRVVEIRDWRARLHGINASGQQRSRDSRRKQYGVR